MGSTPAQDVSLSDFIEISVSVLEWQEICP
jgi:hypothetical protein